MVGNGEGDYYVPGEDYLDEHPMHRGYVNQRSKSDKKTISSFNVFSPKMHPIIEEGPYYDEPWDTAEWGTGGYKTIFSNSAALLNDSCLV